MARQTASVPRLAGMCAEVSDARSSGGPTQRSNLSFYWSLPEQGARLRARGEVTRQETDAAGLPALLAQLSRSDGVEWLDGASDARPRPPGPWFGAVAFDPAQPPGGGWAGFSSVRFAAPETVCWTDGGRSHVAAFAPAGAGRAVLHARLDEARWAADRECRTPSIASDLGAGEGPPDPAGTNSRRDGGTRIEDPGARERWAALVERALSRIHAGELSKVVLARSVDVRAASGGHPPALLGSLEQAYPSCRTFLLRGDGGSLFLGATPEMFCRLDGAQLRTEALAGSARPSEAADLPARPKDRREHAWVVDHLASALAGLAEHVEMPGSPCVRELANVAHLHTPVSARLRAGAGLAEVVAALHPTPAVGGVPAAAAVRFLAEHEHLDRGLYAGLVGVIGPGRAELAVALRCALLSNGTARLFVGAGIVDGSSAEDEWVETQLKARALLDALGAP